MSCTGDFQADFTGFPSNDGPGAGLAAVNHIAGSGGGHGGRGGRARYGYYSSLAYDSIYKPDQMGSGGGAGPGDAGGRGGGKSCPQSNRQLFEGKPNVIYF